MPPSPRDILHLVYALIFKLLGPSNLFPTFTEDRMIMPNFLHNRGGTAITGLTIRLPRHTGKEFLNNFYKIGPSLPYTGEILKWRLHFENASDVLKTQQSTTAENLECTLES